LQAKYYPKIHNAIRKAILLLAQAIDGEPERIDDIVWHASEETEYAAAILSLTHGFTDVDPEFRDKELLEAEMEKIFLSAKNLLCSSLQLLDKDPVSSYEKLRYAVQLLRKVQA
jgi:hypothetical protein